MHLLLDNLNRFHIVFDTEDEANKMVRILEVISATESDEARDMRWLAEERQDIIIEEGKK